METHLSIDRMEMDGHNVNSKRHCTLENGGLKSHLGKHDVVGGEDDTKKVALYPIPITPVTCLENGESVLVVSTLMSSESSRSPNVDEGLNTASNDEVVDSGFEDTPRTPEEGMFDPFAPAAEDMCLAPCKKIMRMSRRITARRISFDDVSELPLSNKDGKDAEIQLEKILLETVYETLLEAIIVNLSADFLAENKDLEIGDCGSPTPPSLLNGIAETCPEAPTKVTGRKVVNIDPGLCRKLEF